MLERPVITLTTDFGLKDSFVGVVKGVICSINPDVNIVDISHNIAPHNIIEASQVIAMSYKYFPKATIHMAVVDPGVGGQRRPILIAADDYYFIGPDNGLFTPIFESQHYFMKVFHITASYYYLPIKSATFHGRDIFAPIAAWLSKGVDSSKFGEEVDDYVKLDIPKPMVSGGTIEGEVIYIDNFGNAMTNITHDKLTELNMDLSGGNLKVLYKGMEINLLNYYLQDKEAGLSALLNSSGLLELFIYSGSASVSFGIKIGDKVSVTSI